MKHLKRKFKRSKPIARILYFTVIVLYLITYALFAKSLISLKGIETVIRYVVLILFALYIISYVFINFLKLCVRKYKHLIITSVIGIILIIVFAFSSSIIDFIYSKLSGLTTSDSVKYKTYLVTKSDTKFSSSLPLGMINDENDYEGYTLAKKLIKKENITNDINEYDNYLDMLYDLYSDKIGGLFISSTYVTRYSQEADFTNIGLETKKVYEISEKKKKSNDDKLISNKSLNEPFTVLFLGVDSEGDGLDDNAAFNGDTLILATFNPNTLSATLFSIPRDTYVPIACLNNNYNKINSSAAYGTKCVIDTIENLTDVNIDYYVKINFKGVVDLVEAVGGVEVNVEAPTYMADKYGGKVCEQNSDRQFGNKLVCMNPGMQTLNGEQALAYARCRHMYIGSDLDRVKHQQQVVEALANKAIHFSSIKEFQDILNAVSKNIATNMDTDTILSGYNVAKNVLGNKLSGKDSINIEKATLETYSLNVYVPSQGRNTSAQGYYKDSLLDIQKSFNVILGKEKKELIKTFSFSVNETYEKSASGKGKRTGASGELLPSFVGKTVSEVESFGSSHNIKINVRYVDSGSEYYNKDVAVGLVGNQSVHKDVLLSTVSELTVYVVNSKETNNNVSENKSDNSSKSNDNKEQLKDDDVIKNMIS